MPIVMPIVKATETAVAATTIKVEAVIVAMITMTEVMAVVTTIEIEITMTTKIVMKADIAAAIATITSAVMAMAM